MAGLHLWRGLQRTPPLGVQLVGNSAPARLYSADADVGGCPLMAGYREVAVAQSSRAADLGAPRPVERQLLPTTALRTPAPKRVLIKSDSLPRSGRSMFQRLM